MKSNSKDGAETGGIAEEVEYKIRQVRDPGKSETKSVVVWTGTKFQIQPDCGEIQEFLEYLDRCRVSSFSFQTFAGSSEIPDELRDIRREFRKPDVGVDKRPVELLIPLIEWCNRNLHELVWQRFRTSQRTRKYEAKRAEKFTVDLRLGGRDRLLELSAQVGLSPSDFLEALQLQADGTYQLCKFVVGAARARAARQEFEDGKRRRQIESARKGVKSAGA